MSTENQPQRGPDEANLAFDESWFERNRGAMLAGLFVAALAGAGGVYWQVQRATEREAAQSLLGTIQETEKLRDVHEQFPGSAAAAQALLALGDSHYQKGEWDQAIEVYRLLTTDYAGYAGIDGAWMGLAAALDAAGRPDEALATLQTVFNEMGASPRAAEARMRAGRLLEAKGDAAGALQMYETLLAVSPQSAWRGMAEREVSRLRPAAPMAPAGFMRCGGAPPGTLLSPGGTGAAAPAAQPGGP